MKITKLKSGMYGALVYMGIKDGKRIQKRFKAKTQSELKRMVNEALYRQDKSLTDAPELSYRLSEAFDMFIQARDNTLSPSTTKAYMSIRANSFKALMDKPVDLITAEDIQREINAMAPLLAPKTIRNKVALLLSVVDKYAHKPLQRSYNIPPKKPRELSIPTKEDVDRLISYCHETPEYHEYELPIILGAYCGLRRGEICALSYDDVDLKAKAIRVTKSQVLTQYNDYEIKAPKTSAGYRAVPLNDYALDLIRKRSKAKLPLISVNISQLSDIFNTTLRHKVGVSCRFHDLRHFFASMLLVNGVPDLYAIRLTGHSTTHMLKNVYQHTFPQQMHEYEEIVRGLGGSGKTD